MHDWAWLLRRAGWLARDQELSRAVHAMGVMIFVASVVWGIVAIRSRVHAIAEPTLHDPAVGTR